MLAGGGHVVERRAVPPGVQRLLRPDEDRARVRPADRKTREEIPSKVWTNWLGLDDISAGFSFFRGKSSDVFSAKLSGIER